MKKLLSILLLLFTNFGAEDFKLEKIAQGFDSPWSFNIYRQPKFIGYRKPGNIKFGKFKEKNSKP